MRQLFSSLVQALKQNKLPRCASYSHVAKMSIYRVFDNTGRESFNELSLPLLPDWFNLSLENMVAVEYASSDGHAMD